jgi:hypothetical protein
MHRDAKWKDAKEKQCLVAANVKFSYASKRALAF